MGMWPNMAYITIPYQWYRQLLRVFAETVSCIYRRVIKSLQFVTLILCVYWTDVLRRQYKNLTSKLDAHVVAVHMYERNAFTLRDLQSIQSLRDHPVEAAETLLNIIMEQPDAVYLCFLDVLKHTEQQHIYQTLVEDGYQGE